MDIEFLLPIQHLFTVHSIFLNYWGLLQSKFNIMLNESLNRNILTVDSFIIWVRDTKYYLLTVRFAQYNTKLLIVNENHPQSK